MFQEQSLPHVSYFSALNLRYFPRSFLSTLSFLFFLPNILIQGMPKPCVTLHGQIFIVKLLIEEWRIQRNVCVTQLNVITRRINIFFLIQYKLA